MAAKEFAVIKAEVLSGKTPVFKVNHPSGRNAHFQEKILLKQKRYSFFQGNFPMGRYASFDMLKKMAKFIRKL